MQSRYELFNESKVKDNKGNNYPDVLSLDIKNIYFNDPLTVVKIDQRLKEKPYLIAFDEYGVSMFDDLIYWLNGVSNVDDLKLGEEIKVPSLSDMRRLYNERVKK